MIAISEELFAVLKENAVVNLIEREGNTDSVALLEEVLRAQFLSEEKKARSHARMERQARQEKRRQEWQQQECPDEECPDEECSDEESSSVEESPPVFVGYGTRQFKFDVIKGLRRKMVGWTLKDCRGYVEENLGLAISSEMAAILSDIGCEIR